MMRSLAGIRRLVAFAGGLWLCAGVAGSHADVCLPRVFGDRMVLQRDREIQVWGWAEPDEAVAVEFADHTAQAAAGADGAWRVTLPATAAGGPHELTVRGNNVLTFRDVLVGEVWFCSGQSNMEWGMKLVDDSESEIAAADHPGIRLFLVPHRTSGYAETDLDASWQVCSPETIVLGGFWGNGFSGVAYFFGRAIHEETGVPVGLIDCSWGGTRIEPWTPRAGFEIVPAFPAVLERIDAATPAYVKATAVAVNDIADWVPRGRAAVAAARRVPDPPVWPTHDLDQVTGPTGIYNGMVHPLVPFTIRGAIWYQGESNRGDGMLYADKMEALILGWRAVWGQGEFPFYFVQLAPFRYGGDKTWLLPEMWEAQTAALAIPNTGMVVTTDVGDLDNIHPGNKQDVGKRLALWALAKTYGRDGLVHSGPLFESMTVDGTVARIRFAHVGSALASRDGGPLTWFQVAGEDRVFHEAEAEIDGDSVVVRADPVPRPVAVRFGWHQEAQPNLVNKEGLPASPFRTDDWVEEEPEEEEAEP